VDGDRVKRYRATVVNVDLDAIRSNVRTVKPDDAELMAVVKADAYGHGDIEVARAALEAGATWLGVALVEEGIRLRDAGIAGPPILLLSEMPPGAERDALAAGLTPTIYTNEGLSAVAKAAADVSPEETVAVHVKVDTGMHRVGLYPPEGLGEFVALARKQGLNVEGIWTHFARSEDDETTTGEQLDEFDRLVEGIEPAPTYLHAANSGATLRHPKAHLHMVRPGIAIYGLAPSAGMPEAADLVPALSWRSAVTMSKRLPAGEAVSYGHSFRLQRESTIVTVPVGYADGYSRRLSNRADVLIRGKRYRVAGNVTMDQVLVDCGEDDVQAGEEVVLLGRQGDDHISAEELADLNDTLNYEVICAISERVPHEYTGRA
jgi:alanine racemase